MLPELLSKGAMPEVCGKAAILSPVDDLEKLVENLARVLTSPTEAQTLREAGANQARRFSWEVAAVSVDI